MTVAEGNGPVSALDQACAKVDALLSAIRGFRLIDYKVRILNPDAATDALTRVMIESADRHGEPWSTGRRVDQYYRRVLRRLARQHHLTVAARRCRRAVTIMPATALPSSVGQPTIILVRPQLAENIGTTTRAMLNCGLTDLRLVQPRENWLSERAIAASSGADAVLHAAKAFETTEAAIADLHRVYAATGRNRFMVKPVVTPRQAGQELRGHSDRGIALRRSVRARTDRPGK